MEKKEFKITVYDGYMSISSEDFAYQLSEAGEIGLLESNSDDESQCNYMSYICEDIHYHINKLIKYLEQIKNG